MRSAASRAFTELVLEIFRLNGRLLDAGEALAGAADQTSARWQVLGSLDGGPRTVADIGRYMGLTRQSVQRTADLLEADGLVSYASNPAHQRAKLAALTPEGRAALDAITTRQIEWADRIAGRLAGDDLQHAIRTLQAVHAALDATNSSSNGSGRARSRGVPRLRPGGRKRRRRS